MVAALTAAVIDAHVQHRVLGTEWGQPRVHALWHAIGLAATAMGAQDGGVTMRDRWILAAKVAFPISKTRLALFLFNSNEGARADREQVAGLG